MIVTHLEPPYFGVIFTTLLSNDQTDYQSTAMRMKELAEQQEGYLGMESARGDLGITVSYWKDLSSITNWKHNLEHSEARTRGKQQWYSQYQLIICKVERAYGFEK